MFGQELVLSLRMIMKVRDALTAERGMTTEPEVLLRVGNSFAC